MAKYNTRGYKKSRGQQAERPKSQEAKETEKPTSHTRQESYKKSSGQEARKRNNQEAKENKKPKPGRKPKEPKAERPRAHPEQNK